MQFMHCFAGSVFVCMFVRFDVLMAFFKVSFLFFIRKQYLCYIQFPCVFAPLFGPLPGSEHLCPGLNASIV